jgi:hypothetical protein
LPTPELTRGWAVVGDVRGRVKANLFFPRMANLKFVLSQFV